MPVMTTKTMPKTSMFGKFAKSVKSAFGSDEDEPKPAPVGHTRLDEDQEDDSMSGRMTASIKRRTKG